METLCSKIIYDFRDNDLYIKFFSLIIAFVDNTFSIKIYNITAVVCLLSLILRGRQGNYNIKKLILPLSIFFIGLLDLIWYSLFKVDNSPFRATYHNYLNTAKIFLFGSFIVFLALTSKLKQKKKLHYMLCILCHL